ncbi:hypothetical protein CVT24_013049 [Panaeolus cyanescens]|uniref:Uncharacterized protein n=1 Tax=Panaeolus cyanescens TaxID=181874 RepID=A0A409YUR7_9AGAR|nr:hypothetical protein CVT24_013049 [Panaeolus cyanescens]
MMLTVQYHRVVLILLALAVCLSSAAPTNMALNQQVLPSPHVALPSSLPSSSSPLSSLPEITPKLDFQGPSVLKQIMNAPKVVLGFLHAYSGLPSSSRLTTQYSARLRPHRRLPRPHPVSPIPITSLSYNSRSSFTSMSSK